MERPLPFLPRYDSGDLELHSDFSFSYLGEVAERRGEMARYVPRRADKR